MFALTRYAAPSTLSNWLDELLGDTWFESTNRQIPSGTWPRVDIAETEEGYTIHADLPGLDKKDVSVRIENGVLSIEGEKKQVERKVEKGRYSHLERSYGSFRRAFSLPDSVDPSHVEARLTDGVLEVSLKKSEQAKPKAIEVKVG